MNIIGTRLKELREKEGLSQKELARKLNLANSTLSQYETGQRVPSDDIKIKMADMFHTTLDYLLGRTDKQSNENNNKGNDRNDLSLESQKQLEEYEKLLRIKEQMDKSKDETSSALENEA